MPFDQWLDEYIHRLIAAGLDPLDSPVYRDDPDAKAHYRAGKTPEQAAHDEMFPW